MEINTRLDSLKSLPFVHRNNELHAEFDQFVRYLQDNRQSDEPKVFGSNILKELRNYKTGIIEEEDHRFVTLGAIIRYAGKHHDQLKICQQIFKEIVYIIQKKPAVQTDSSSVYELYKNIAERLTWCDDVLELVEFDPNQSVYAAHKSKFSTIEWKRICLFENHFSKHVDSPLQYDIELKEKWSYLNNLENVKHISESALKKCQKTITENNNRKAAAFKIDDINFVNNGITHAYTKLDNSLTSSLKEYISTDVKGLAVSCGQCCVGHQGDVHVFIDAKETDLAYKDEITEIVKSALLKDHSLTCSEIVFLQEGTLDKYVCRTCEEGQLHRFELQNSYVSKRLHSFVTLVVKITEIDRDNNLNFYQCDDQQKLCVSCFEEVIPWVNNRLDWRSVIIEKEWLLNVPLEIQNILLTLFINKNTLQKSEDKASTLANKLSKLYCLFDSALATYNKCYCGVIQQLNTQELAINYHALSTVFNITSNSGITKSLKNAERWLKSAADPDRNLFETYIKQYRLLYQSIKDDAPESHRVNLQQCFVVLFMDNLVRLTVHEDPNPGQSRTSQICTLPITFKGVPRDSAIVQSWHGEDCVEKAFSQSCACMDADQLKKTDIALLTENTESETMAWEKFQAQVTWGMTSLTTFHTFILDTISSSEESVDTPDQHHETAMSNELPTTSQCASSSTFDTDIEEENVQLDELENQFETSLNLDATVEEDDFCAEINQNVQDDPDDMISMVDRINHYEQMDTVDEGGVTGISYEEEKDIKLAEFTAPPLLCRHPVPATGRDDDIVNLRDILLDTVQKLGRKEDQKDRILFAPDHKISKNLLKLMKENKVIKQFLPEFPVLHLRKSKIVNLFGAYKSAGLLHLVKFMKDSEQEDDWMKLLTLQNINTASRNICRLSVALHTALLIAFYQALDCTSQIQFKDDLEHAKMSHLHMKWDKRLSAFVKQGMSRNATFALHVDVMKHCDEIVAISTAESISGPDGYSLLLAAVKSSLPFAFLNGASSYASFCVELLHEHYSAGVFHRNMKMSLFSTPHKDGNVNVALDAQREMDHKDAIKGFRPRSTVQSVIPRMSIVDHFTEVQKARQQLAGRKSKPNDVPDVTASETVPAEERLQIPFTDKDYQHALPVCTLLVRQEAFSSAECLVPHNVYEHEHKPLPCEILDEHSYGIGRFLIKKYATQQEMFQLTKEDTCLIDDSDVPGPTKLAKKAKVGKSVTMRRVGRQIVTSTPLNTVETKRKAQVKKQTKVLDCMSSSMNTCQSLVNPDGSKASVQKAQGIRKALIKVMSQAFNETNLTELDKVLQTEDILICETENILKLHEMRDKTAFASMEFAGIKFKTKATSGEQYLQHIQNGIIGNVLYMFPNIEQLIICEEKYSFTPDDLKSATREKRQTKQAASIAHLKHGEDILCDHKLSKSATVNTSEGKRMISNYLARNIQKLKVNKSIEIIVDSELIMAKCQCTENCTCSPSTHPVKTVYTKDGFETKTVITEINQRKGEAEMAQVDWLSTLGSKVSSGQAIVSVVTSGDIDSVVIHLFALSLHWPRQEDGTFKNSVYVLLQKSKPELYNITKMIEVIEKCFGFRYAAANIAVICCCGGNDFVPKMNGMTHERWVSTCLNIPGTVKGILHYSNFTEYGTPTSAILDQDLFIEVVKHMYCPNSFNPDHLTLSEVRQMTIKMPGKVFRHPTSWMPPKEALQSMCEIVQCQVDYLFTSFDHGSELPNFLGRGCLTKNEHGAIQYDFGSTSRTDMKEDLVTIDEDNLMTTMCGAKRTKRRNEVFTPKKDVGQKRRPKMSTPKKMKDFRQARGQTSPDINRKTEHARSTTDDPCHMGHVGAPEETI